MKKLISSEIEIVVATQFIPERSVIEHNRFFFTYTVSIKNSSSQKVQLVRRHWIFENALGETFEVKGSGVVGEKPVIPAGGVYSYTSATEINTPSGVMYGAYQMLDESAREFEAKIEKFTLIMPRVLH
ncbi:MAG: Co2+/Mg2+ efflux protein ApaG [Methylophilaceae bacterium]